MLEAVERAAGANSKYVTVKLRLPTHESAIHDEIDTSYE
ncbi:tRNA-dihydrouridine synthase [Phyllobacterium endophyticum]|jgi:hypothetical protein|nr:tRNA-dihydrouridine synthase [Phyllobacterium endophyticum]